MADLKELGVSLGHRRRLLKAIEELAGRPGVPAAGADTYAGIPAPRSGPPPSGGS